MSVIKPLKILKASAGSGKTFSLTVHYLTLLFSSEAKYREILAVTFTNKATEEMKSRILEVLKGLAKNDQGGLIDSYRAIILQAYPGTTALDLAQKATVIYRRILHDYSRFSVSTIDGFVQKVIRSFAFELGLDASYALEMNLEKVQNNLVDRLDRELDKNPALVQWMIDMAMERIDNENSWNYKQQLLDLTKEIFKEKFALFALALQHIGYEHVDALFERYAKETKAFIVEVQQSIKKQALQIQHEITRVNLQADQLKGKSRNPLLKMDKIIALDLPYIAKLEKLVDEPEEWFQKNQDPAPYALLNPLVGTLYRYYQQHKAAYILAKQFLGNVYYLRLMQELAILLKDYRDETGNLLISDAQNLLSGITDDAGDNPSFIWEKIGNRYKNFLFDEFQDTSIAQWDSFKSLVQNALAEPSQTHIDHLIVGDTKQSIYRWRNGDWNILESGAKAQLGAYHVVDDNLEENYRSSTEVIQFNNHLYNELPQLIQQHLNNSLAEAEQSDLSSWWQQMGYDHIVTKIYDQVAQHITPHSPKGGIVKVQKFAKDEDDERMHSDSVFREQSLAYSIAEIKQLQLERGYAYRDMCVLVRKNPEAKEVVQALMEAGIPVVSGEALMIANNSAIQLLINTLQALVSYTKNTALYKANCISLYHKIHHLPLAPNHYLGLTDKDFIDLIGILPEELCTQAPTWVQLPLPELVEKIIHAYALSEKREHLAYLLAFRDLTANAAKQGEKGILSFLHWWQEDGVRKTLPSPDDANAVQVMTIHKSKGLAFRAVFIPFCNIDLGGKTNSTLWVPAAETDYKELYSIPLQYNATLAETVVASAYFEEYLYSHIDALNMLYVATTRAKDYLFIGVKHKAKYDKISNTGDLIEQVFGAVWNDDLAYSIEEPVYKKETPSSKEVLELQQYPTSMRLTEIYSPLEERQAHHVLNTNDAGRNGSILHEILAAVAAPEQIDSYLENLVLEGILQTEEIARFAQDARAVLEHQELQALLQQAVEVRSEKAIINRDGKQYRPDKILHTADALIVIDYKFTFAQKESHLIQVQDYMHLLRQMDYQNVQGYLFYASTKTLKPVN